MAVQGSKKRHAGAFIDSGLTVPTIHVRIHDVDNCLSVCLSAKNCQTRYTLLLFYAI